MRGDQLHFDRMEYSESQKHKIRISGLNIFLKSIQYQHIEIFAASMAQL